MKTRILASSSLLVGVLFTMASGCAAGEMPDAGMDAPGRDAPFVERVDADLDTVVPIDAPTEPQDAWMGDAGSVAWPVRSCEQTIRYARGGSRVEVAGDFNGWTRRAMSDVDGDGVFEIALGTADGLRAGEVHAYKLIVDDTWIIDPESSMRRYDGACINSAFRAPACTSGPEIVVTEPVAVSFDGATELASVTTELELRLASDGALPRSVSFTLDGTAVPATLDARGHYTVSLRDVPIGRHLLAVRATDAMDREAEPVDLPFWVEARPWSWRDAVMYMIVVDRFANGDRTDDRPVGAPVEYPADFHGGDLEGILEVMRSGYFEELGVNVLWLSPINQQAEGHFAGRDDGHEYAGYHGYWPSRARDVEPRFGGNEALRALVDEAHRRGIRVLFDLINNQIHTQHEYFGPHPEWFRTGCVCGQDPGCGWSERPLDCLFASYLPDINWRVPDAEEQFVADAIHWVDAFGIDGFRIDAVKHVETSSIYNLRTALHRRFEQGGERLYLVGETAVGQWDSADYGCGESFANGYGWIDAYVGEYGLDGQFDFPSHHRTQYGLVTDTMSFTDLEGVVRDMETRYRPEGLHVRFLGTHDSNRIASRAAMSPAVDCRWAGGGSCSTLASTPTDAATFGRIRRAFTALYAMPGIPFLYYGDEIATAGGNDPDNRRDMAWTGALSSVAMGGATSVTAEQEALRDHLGALGRARADSSALRRGRRVPLLVEPDLYVVAWADEVEGTLAVVAINRGGGVTGRNVDGLVPTVRGRAVTLEAVAGSGSATLSGSRMTLTVPAGGAVVFLGRE
jgi:glycosidase